MSREPCPASFLFLAYSSCCPCLSPLRPSRAQSIATTRKPAARDDVVLIRLGQGMKEAARTRTALTSAPPIRYKDIAGTSSVSSSCCWAEEASTSRGVPRPRPSPALAPPPGMCRTAHLQRPNVSRAAFRSVNMNVSGLSSTRRWTGPLSAQRESRLDGWERRPLQQSLLLQTTKVTFVTCDVAE